MTIDATPGHQIPDEGLEGEALGLIARHVASRLAEQGAQVDTEIKVGDHVAWGTNLKHAGRVFNIEPSGMLFVSVPKRNNLKDFYCIGKDSVTKLYRQAATGEGLRSIVQFVADMPTHILSMA